MRPQNLFISVCVLLCFLAISTAAQSQSKQTPQRDAEKERAIRQQLQAVSPSSVETFKQATDALDSDNYAEAARLYEQVVKQAPQFTPALRRLGMSYVQTGKPDDGLALMEKAVKLERSPENLVSLAEALAYPGPGREAAPGAKERALILATEADAKAVSADVSYPALVAQLSLDLEQKESFQSAVRTLKQKFPDEMPTHYFSAINAAWDEDWMTADSEIRKAEALGLPHEVAQQFLDSGVGTRAAVWRYTFYVLYLAAAWALGLVALFALGKIFSSLTMRSVVDADPDELTGSRHERLRKAYRALITFAGFYYYVSLPVVLCLVLLAAAAIIYASLMLGHIPIKLILIFVVGGIVTVYQMIRSLFVKAEQEDPGRSLLEKEAPGLWELTREVAGVVGTRAVDEIRVTTGTDLAVYERGSTRERRKDRGQRILILGVGVLNGFGLNAFRAVLAHEYGHFVGRDTAGGDVALRVNKDMLTFAYSMARAGQAVWYNVAFQFVRVYHFIFRRISHGATRLQEMLADRVAVYNYGPRAFKDGLSHVVYRGVEFKHLATREINAAVSARRALQNLYELPEAKGGEAERDVETAFNEALHRKTTEDDTHPSPVERFRLASRIKTKGEPASDGTVWDLFADREGLTREMSGLIAARVKTD
jgi:tetratricopeptide (TPR) repeat protein